MNRANLLELSSKLTKNDNIFSAYSFANLIDGLSKKEGAVQAFLSADFESLLNDGGDAKGIFSNPINADFNKVSVYMRVNMRRVSELKITREGRNDDC